ncbi:MucR family transcriptional regulator [Streptomyces sp. NPDC002055]|uniref:MucR family transcriptional regulator n=1 Tax=Streptomyces sp. NPDC002055 TaxID=3154534 RepID=UPI00332F977A
MTVPEPDGVQPVEDSRLQCLECGRWFRLMAPHLKHAHAMTTAEYRQAHRLPRKLSLRAPDLTERARGQGRERFAAREDMQAAFAAGREMVVRAACGAGTRATADYPMVVEARRRGGQGHRRKSLQRIDAAAQSLGFADRLRRGAREDDDRGHGERARS